MSDITDQLRAENDALKERVERLERELAHLKMLFERSELQGGHDERKIASKSRAQTKRGQTATQTANPSA